MNLILLLAFLSYFRNRQKFVNLHKNMKESNEIHKFWFQFYVEFFSSNVQIPLFTESKIKKVWKVVLK